MDWRATAVSTVSEMARIASESVAMLSSSRSVHCTITAMTITTPSASSATSSRGSTSRRRATRVDRRKAGGDGVNGPVEDNQRPRKATSRAGGGYRDTTTVPTMPACSCGMQR